MPTQAMNESALGRSVSGGAGCAECISANIAPWATAPAASTAIAARSITGRASVKPAPAARLASR